MRRARLVAHERASFKAAGREIDEALSRGSIRCAECHLKALMDRLLAQRNEQTLELFVEMRQRWNDVMDIYSYLQENWGEWATWEHRLELIWQEFGRDPQDSEFIQTVYSSMKELANNHGSLPGKRRSLLEQVLHYRQNAELRHALILLIVPPGIPGFEVDISELRQIFADQNQHG